MRLTLRILCLTSILAVVAVSRATAGKFDAKVENFWISFHGHTSAYHDISTVVMPDATVTFEITGGRADDVYELGIRDGVGVPSSARKWRWTAPSSPGVYTLRFSDRSRGGSITVHALVMVPASEVRNGTLNGYRIGDYPTSPPPGFIEVTKENQDTKVSPHFQLKQFVCKQDPPDHFPKYILLQELLPLKLEAVLQEVNALGFDADTLHVMSGYRTPFYNDAIGDVRLSQHQWGSAADIFVDTEHKDQMDDLNRDGRIDVNDSRFLYDAIERLLAQPMLKPFQGGMGFYPATSAHPPFVHVDVRGAAARWRG
jgi:hypothetical protein